MIFDSVCNTGLSLSLGSMNNDRGGTGNYDHQKNKFLAAAADNNNNDLFPSLTLGLSLTTDDHDVDVDQITSVIKGGGGGGDYSCYNNNIIIMHGGGGRQQGSSVSAVSSFHSNSSVKREGDHENSTTVEEVEVENKVVISPKAAAAASGGGHIDDDQDQDVEELLGPRKKLRLTKEQSVILEDTFKEHTTLNPKQKQALAKRLNLRPRQVEVWFQNRRARTKLKQTEVDYEVLKKCCESLKEENRRLHRELQELKGMKLTGTGSLYMHLPAATLSMCPSCERIAAAGGGNSAAATAGTETLSSSKISFSIGANKPHFYGPFANPSAAC